MDCRYVPYGTSEGLLTQDSRLLVSYHYIDMPYVISEVEGVPPCPLSIYVKKRLVIYIISSS